VTSHGARADLTLVFHDRQDGLAGEVEYDLGLFGADTIERMCGRLLRLLAAGADQPDTMVSRLPFTTGTEAAELARWNATAGPALPSRTLTEMVSRQARRTPARTAVTDDTARISYAELDERSGRIARWLRAAGIGAGRPVGVQLPRGVDQVAALAGVLKAGGAYLPLDPGYPAERLAFMRADAGASVLITRSDLVRGGTETGVLLVDRPWQPPAGAPERWTEPVHPDQPAYILYTSGSTGRPKGVVNTHRGLVNRLGWMREAFRAGPGDVILYKTPMSFDVSLWELVLPAMCGAEMVVARPDGHMDPGYLTDLIERHGVTMIHFVPSMLQAFLAAADPARCRSLRQVLCSGEALSSVLRRQFFEAGFTAALDNLYGPTEAAIDVTRWPCAADEAGEVPIGHPILNTQAYLLDANGEQLPVGIPGELWLGGDQLALGYVGQPGLTAASFVPDPFHAEPGRRLYRTGDIARRRRDGAIQYLGRQDQQVKLRGHRIELTEIEVALRTHEGVADAVVLLSGPAADARLVAYVVPEGSAPANAELREHLGRVLPAYMVPASYAFVEGIPLTANGKADRNALRAITPEAVRAAEYVEPRDDVEAAVARLFAQLTGVERVSARDDFFEIGGHSLLALRLRARLVGEFGIDMPLREIFEDPTVEGVAGKIVGQIMRWVDAAETAAE
jgi:amino acid adenylation domain-containing protein